MNEGMFGLPEGVLLGKTSRNPPTVYKAGTGVYTPSQVGMWVAVTGCGGGQAGANGAAANGGDGGWAADSASRLIICLTGPVNWGVGSAGVTSGQVGGATYFGPLFFRGGAGALTDPTLLPGVFLGGFGGDGGIPNPGISPGPGVGGGAAGYWDNANAPGGDPSNAGTASGTTFGSGGGGGSSLFGEGGQGGPSSGPALPARGYGAGGGGGGGGLQAGSPGTNGFLLVEELGVLSDTLNGL